MGQFSPSLCKAGKLTVGQAGLLCIREPHKLAPKLTTTETQDRDPLLQSQGGMHSSAFSRTPLTPLGKSSLSLSNQVQAPKSCFPVPSPHR